MHIAHHPIFAALSMVIACFASWTALDLFRRVRAHTGIWQGAWLFAAAVAMGLGIWAMHFIAMLGFNPGAEVRYDIRLTLLSLALAIAATAFAFFFAAGRHPARLAIGGLVMGAGICIMHYVGMAALITSVGLGNDPLFVVLAFLVAVTASGSALIVAKRERTFAQRFLAAVVLGFAIVGMHYTAMFGVHLLPTAAAPGVSSGIDVLTLAIAVASGTFLILFLALIAALSDRRFEALAAQEASRSEQQLRAVMEHLPLGVFVAAAPSGEIRFANAEAERLLGHAIEPQAIWMHQDSYGAVHPDGQRLGAEEHALYEAMHAGRRVGPRLQSYRRGDGRIVQLEVTAAPVPDRSAGNGLAVVAFQDVTQKLAAEARIAAALAEKAEAEAALSHAQRLESLGRLTGGVAHDFNNLLTVVIGALDIILRHPENHQRRKKLGEAALAAARRGERLTAQLLAFARRQPLQPEECDLNDLVRESEPLIRRAIGDGIELDVRLCETPAAALIDPVQFEASLLNLVVNAVDAISAGGRIKMQSTVRNLAAEEECSGLPAGRYFCVSVSDTGMGMSSQVLDRIFEPFFTTKGPGKGTGLGLSQVYGFVKQSGGEVQVRSIEGEGTTVSVYLPVTERVVTRARPQETATHGRSDKQLKILLVEDEPSVATVTEAMLRNLGHEVTWAENARHALRVLHSPTPFDLLLSDVIMPGGVNGVELAEQAASIRPGIKILLSSGYAGGLVDEALARSAWPLLRKPYLEDELAAQLDELYDGGAPAA